MAPTQKEDSIHQPSQRQRNDGIRECSKKRRRGNDGTANITSSSSSIIHVGDSNNNNARRSDNISAVGKTTAAGSRKPKPTTKTKTPKTKAFNNVVKASTTTTTATAPGKKDKLSRKVPLKNEMNHHKNNNNNNINNNINNNSINNNTTFLDVTKRKTANQCARRWSAILTARDYRKRIEIIERQENNDNTNNATAPNHHHHHHHRNHHEKKEEMDDPFDCSDLIVPSARAILEREASAAMERWRDLDARVLEEVDIIGHADDDDDDDNDADADADDGNDERVNNDAVVVPRSNSAIGIGRLATRTATTTTTATTSSSTGGGNAKSNISRNLLLDGTMCGDGRKQRLLPPNFDYQCKGRRGGLCGDGGGDDGGSGGNTKDVGLDTVNNPPPYYRPKVISLLDPTQSLDYEDELWQVFRSMPTLAEVEEKYGIEGGGGNGDATTTLDNVGDGSTTGGANRSPRFGCQHTLRVKNDLKAFLPKYTRMDAHSLGRLRIRDRHSMPMSVMMAAADSSHSSNGGRISNSVGGTIPRQSSDDGGKNDEPTTLLQTTVRFEILRYSMNLKRQSTPDANRLEVELNGSHTLLDLHRVLVECQSSSSTSCIGGGKGVGGSEGEKIMHETSTSGGGGGGDCEEEVAAGVFFVENVFYTHGDAGKQVSDAIVHWMNGSQHQCRMEDKMDKNDGLEGPTQATGTFVFPPRRHYLGLPPVSCKDFVPMSNVLLEDMPLRLGVRYFHMFVSPTQTPSSSSSSKRRRTLWSLGNESALFVTGIHTHNNHALSDSVDAVGKTIERVSASTEHKDQKELTNYSRTPIIIHDIWTPPQRFPVCLACNFAHATVVTVNDELTDASSFLTIGNSCVDSINASEFQGTPLCSGCYRELHYKRVGASTLELRSSHRPLQVFPVEDFYRKAVEASLNSVSDNAPF